MAQEQANKPSKKKKKDSEDGLDAVLPNLYLGGIVAYGFLSKYKIECILNCAIEIKHDQEDIAEMKLWKYKHICMDDVVSEKLSKHIDEGMSFIAACVDKEEKVTLVHCMEGKSRSVSMVLGYLSMSHLDRCPCAMCLCVHSEASRVAVVEGVSALQGVSTQSEAQQGVLEVAHEAGEGAVWPKHSVDEDHPVRTKGSHLSLLSKKLRHQLRVSGQACGQKTRK